MQLSMTKPLAAAAAEAGHLIVLVGLCALFYAITIVKMAHH